MLHRPLTGLTAALLATTALAAKAEELVVYHNWSSEAEVGALNVLKSGLEAKGHTWTDVAIPHDTGSNVNLLSLVTGGNPPNVFLESSPGFYRDLEGMGLARPLTEFYAEQGYPEHLPASVMQAITIDGEIMKVPTAIHIDGMVYYNKEVAAAAGVDPAAWDSLDAMFADFEKVSSAGYVPLALGGQQWQIGYLMHTLAATTGGVDFFPSIYAPEPDPAAIDSPEMRTTLEWLRRFQQATADLTGKPMPAEGRAADPDEAQAIYDGQPARVGCIKQARVHGKSPKVERRSAGRAAPGSVEDEVVVARHLLDRLVGGHRGVDSGHGRYAYYDTVKDLGVMVELLKFDKDKESQPA